jgi:hypothetical protein
MKFKRNFGSNFFKTKLATFKEIVEYKIEKMFLDISKNLL